MYSAFHVRSNFGHVLPTEHEVILGKSVSERQDGVLPTTWNVIGFLAVNKMKFESGVTVTKA